MLVAGKWVLGIVTGGLLLGTLLGRAADPDMKEPPAPWWQLTGSEDLTIQNQGGLVFVEAGPEDTNPGGFRPDLDYDALAWNLPLPDYDFAHLLDEPADQPADWPTVTYGVTAAEEAADQAEAAAGEALAAEPVEVAEAAPAPGEVRKSELALAGLY